MHTAETMEPASDEQECIEAVKNGSREAYSTIVKKYMKKAYYIALGFVKTEQDALDVSQEAFIKAYRHIRKFKSGNPFFPWFYRILKNLCLDCLKKNKNRNTIPLENIKLSEGNETEEILKIQLWDAIEKLPLDQREVLILRYFQGCSYSEMARILDKPMGTIMSCLYYAKKRLKEKMEKVLK